MKKQMIAILAGAMLTLGMAGNALAYFTAPTAGADLIRVVYQTANGTVETATDLGSVSSLIGQSNLNVGGGAAAFTNYGVNSASFGDYAIAYFALTSAGSTKQVWVSGDATTATVNLGSGWNTTNGGITNILNTYAGIATSTGTVQSDTTAPANTYFKTADGSGTKTGALVGIVGSASRANTEASLANLASAPITQGLWYFATAGTTGTGTLAMTLTTNADGSTTINAQDATPTPVPPAFLLMGSGLLGMVGLRRKKA